MTKKIFLLMLSLVMLLGISCSKKEPVEPEIVLSPDEQKLLVALDSFRNIFLI